MAWDAPNEPSVSGYRLHYGQASRNYTTSIDLGSQTSYTVTGLQEGKTYYFAATAINSVGESGFSNEASKAIPYPAPTANFNANPLIGTAPLTVSFNDASTGTITDWRWDFGNGATSTASGALFSYDLPGTYTVSLTVTGPGGADTKTRTDYITVSAADTGAGGGDTGTGGGDTGTGGGDTGTGGGDTGTGGGDTGTGGGDTGLVAAYGFDEDGGATVKDASGKGNHGEILGAQRTTQGRYGKALLFDGVNDWVTVPDSDSLDLDTGMTIEAWVYPTATLSSWRDVVMKEQSGGTVYYLTANSDSSMPATGVFIGAEQILYAGTRLEPNKWSHVAATYDGAIQRLYLDGTEVGSQPMSGPIQHSNGVLRIGGDSIWGEYFPGYIDEVRIYNRALAGDEIRGDMGAALARPFVIEAGELSLDHNWKRVSFAKSFADPVVTANALSSNGADPAVVRIRDVDATGFDVRIQEWEYLDGIHTTERVGYVVVERGSYVLPGGTRIEAGALDTDATAAFETVKFKQAFNVAPVVFTAVSSVNEVDAVTTRVRNIYTTGFSIHMQEQEANKKEHATETISYIAWEPSVGSVNGLSYEVGRTPDVVRHKFYTVDFLSGGQEPLAFLAHMQTSDGGDTANLRWQNKGLYGAAVKVSEEQSANDETRHTREVVGYGVFATVK